MSPEDRTADLARIGRLAFVAVLAVYGVACLRSPGTGRFLDGIDLAIHETGHIVFGFGEVLTALGGTLLQVLFPVAFVVYFLRRRDRFAAAVCLWWVAQNLWNVSVYVADARTQELPLVGGGEHDWAFLLGEYGWLPFDTRISRGIHAVGVLIFVASLLLGAHAAFDPPREDAVTDAAP